MRAIKLQAHVTKDRVLHLQLPEDVREGPAEVIVLVPEQAERTAHTLRDFLADFSARRQVRTKEEIDWYLEEERNTWN